MTPDLIAAFVPALSAIPIEMPVLLALAAVAIGALAVFLFVRALRAQVKARTAELERRTSEIGDLNAQLEISNEELQTSKEELESANEELQLLNADLEARNRELSAINNELTRLKEFKERVIATVPAALLVIDGTYKLLAANWRYEEMRHVSEKEIVGTPLAEALPTEVLNAGGLLDAVERVIQRRKPVRLRDVPAPDIHGTPRYYDIIVSALIETATEDQTKAQYLIALRDVTHEHTLGQAVREQERYLRRLVDNPLVGVVTCTPDWRIKLFNVGAERLTGSTSSEMTGRDIGSFLVEGWDTTRERLESRRPVENAEATARDRDGNAVPVAVFAAPLEDAAGELIGYLIISADLRERKAMEQNLLRRNRELAMLYDVARTLNQSLDLNELLEAAMQRLLETFPVDCSCVLLTGDIATARPPALLCQHGGDPVNEATCAQLHAFATRRFVRDRAPLFVPDLIEEPETSSLLARADENASAVFVPLCVRDELLGIIVLMSHSFRQFSDEETALLSSAAQSMAAVVKNVRLYNDLTQTVADLRQAQEQLLRTEKLRSIGELAAGVAHDINNVLGIILGHAQLLLEATADPQMHEGLHAIEQAARDGARTVERIQDFVRAKRVEGFKPIDLNGVIQELVQITDTRLKQEAEFRDVHVELRRITGRIEPIEADERELREALTNIVFNAIDAMPRGGTLTIETGQKGRRVFVRIEDTGVGMNADVKGRMFDPFFTTKGVKGTGLGLSVAYGIIRHNRGLISVESEVGQGTTVMVSFPAAAETMQPIPEPEEAPEEIVEALRVLLIDDNIELNRIIRDILTRAGHTVEIAHDGPEGVSAFRRGRHDFVISDIGMPGMSGWDVAKAVKQESTDTGVILLTGWDRQGYRHHPHRAHADALLAKPIDRKKLLRVLSKMTARRPKWPEISKVAEDGATDGTSKD
jgi:PAS domain S-box-containing protein